MALIVVVAKISCFVSPLIKKASPFGLLGFHNLALQPCTRPILLAVLAKNCSCDDHLCVSTWQQPSMTCETYQNCSKLSCNCGTVNICNHCTNRNATKVNVSFCLLVVTQQSKDCFQESSAQKPGWQDVCTFHH